MSRAIRQLTMADRLKGHEIFPSAESVFNRLNEIDFRLRQLEEKERLPESYFAADLRVRSNQLPSNMDDVRLKEELMDRLNLLETRIRQLSQELDKGSSSGGSGGGDSMMTITFPAEKQKQILYSSSSREEARPWRAGSDIYQSQMSKKKAMEPMQAATTETMNKRAAASCRNEKRRMDRPRLYKRWFQVGC